MEAPAPLDKMAGKLAEREHFSPGDNVLYHKAFFVPNVLSRLLYDYFHRSFA